MEVTHSGLHAASRLRLVAMMQPKNTERGLKWIGGFKLLIGLLLAAAATGVLAFVHEDVAAIFTKWVNRLHFDPEGRYLAALLEQLNHVEDRHLQVLSGVTFAYAGLQLTEGVGLLMKKLWAEYLTVVATSSLIPVEIYEVLMHFSLWKLILLIVNAGIVWFLIRALKRSPDTLEAMPELETRSAPTDLENPTL